MYTYTQGHSRIAGTGIYLPDERVTTEDLMREIDSKARFGVPYNWLERVTGIKEKRVTPEGVLPSDMAVRAAKEAMERAKITPRQIDAIIYTGVTRDYLEPATAHIVQAKLDATHATVFDIANACNGFMNGIHVMDALIATGQVRNGLVVTGEQGKLFAHRAIETLTSTTERTKLMSLATGLTLGDAGAAIIMKPKVAPVNGFMGFMLQSQGQYARFCTAGGPLTEGPVFADMPSIVGQSAKLVTKMFNEFMYGRLKWQIQEISKYFIHQVGTRAFYLYNRILGVPTAIMPKTVDTLGNLITANIPLSIHYCLVNREIREGNKVYLSGMGSGISLSQAGLIWDAA